MALYEVLGRHDPATANPNASSRAIALAHPASSAEHMVGMIRVGFLALLLACWVAGAYAGIVYWSLQGSLLGVIASALVPGIAATFTWSAFTTLQGPAVRRP